MEQVWRRSTAALAVLGALLAADAAQAQWRGGVHVGVAPYPHHQPYYAAPPYHAAPAATEGCYAGAWVCPLERPALVGMPCACPTGQGPNGQGQAWGRAR